MALKSIQTANLDTIRETGAYVVMDLINGPEAGPHLIQVTEMNAGGTRRVVQVVHALSSGAIRARMNKRCRGRLGSLDIPGRSGSSRCRREYRPQRLRGAHDGRRRWRFLHTHGRLDDLRTESFGTMGFPHDAHRPARYHRRRRSRRKHDSKRLCGADDTGR